MFAHANFGEIFGMILLIVAAVFGPSILLDTYAVGIAKALHFPRSPEQLDVNRPLVPASAAAGIEARKAELEAIADRENMQQLLRLIDAEATRRQSEAGPIRINLVSNLTADELEALRLRLPKWGVWKHDKGLFTEAHLRLYRPRG